MSSTRRPKRYGERDFFRTPAWCIDRLIGIGPDGEVWPSKIPDAKVVLDPACGDGAILNAIRARDPDGRRWNRMVGIDIEPMGQPNSLLMCADFLSVEGLNLAIQQHTEVIVANPPYNGALEFVCQSLGTVGQFGTVAMLLRDAFAESIKRRDFHRRQGQYDWVWHRADRYTLSDRPSFTDDGKKDSCAYSWFVWGPHTIGRWETL